MSAYEIPNMRFSAVAGGTVAQRRFVKLDASEQGIQATLGSVAIGVSTLPAVVNEVLEIADGIVMVEAGGVIAVGDQIQSDATGKAIKATTGIVLGSAMTPAAAAGELVTVKLPLNFASIGVSNLIVIPYDIAELAAGADLAATPFYVVPTGYAFTTLSIDVLALGANAGIDADNTTVIAIKEGANAIATKTYDAEVAFPASGAADNLGAITNPTLTAGEKMTVAVTNGATADIPVCKLFVTGLLYPSA